MTCPLCGLVCGPGAQAWACERCPLARGCRLARCPRCGYEWAEQSTLVTWARRCVARLRGLCAMRS